MKTLKELAANFNLFTFDDVPAKYRTNLDRVSQFAEPIPDLFGLESGYFYTCTHDTNYNGEKTYYVESHGSILCKHQDHDFIMRLSFDSRAKKYSFHLSWEELRKYQDISTYLRDNALKGLEIPNMIGIFTAKKITDWVNYCAEYKRRMDALLDEVTKKNSGQVQELKDFAERMKNMGANVREWMDGKNLTLQIDAGLFDVWIKHHAGENYIEKKIRFDGDLQDVEKITENFLKKINKKIPTMKAFIFLSERLPGIFDDLDLSKNQLDSMLLDFQMIHGHEAVEKMAGFYLYALECIKSENRTDAIRITIGHDLFERAQPCMLPRTDGYLKFWHDEKNKHECRSDERSIFSSMQGGTDGG